MYVFMYLFITIAAALIAVTVKYIPLFTNHSSSTLNESEPRNKIFYMKYMSNIIINVELYLNCTFLQIAILNSLQNVIMQN